MLVADAFPTPTMNLPFASGTVLFVLYPDICTEEHVRGRERKRRGGREKEGREGVKEEYQREEF